MVNAGKIVPAPGITVHTDKQGVTREYREVKRKAQQLGEIVKVVDMQGVSYEVGDVFSVERHIDASGVGITDSSGGRNALYHSEYIVLEPTDIVHYDGKRWREVKKPGSPYSYETVRNGLRIYLDPIDEQPDRLTALEQRVSHLSAEVAHLRRVVAVRVTANSVADRNEGALQKMTDVFGDMFKPNTLTPRLTRADVIELAKKDVEDLQRKYVRPQGRGWRTHYVVNRKKRTVVAYNRSDETGYVANRGIAKSAPDDCFNVHIGKAIALRRALGLDVPDYYVNAPKPTGVQKGDVVQKTSKTKWPGHQVTVRSLVDYWIHDLQNGYVMVIDDSHDFGGEGIG